MKRFVLTKSADRDLDQIKSFLVEKARLTIARKVLTDIRMALEFLGTQAQAIFARTSRTVR